MKSHKIIIIMFVGLLFSSCKETTTRFAAIRRIINETQYKVDIEIFETIDDTLTYEVNKFDTLEISGYCASSIISGCFIGWRLTYDTFANIYFDQDRVLRFSSPAGRSRDEKFIVVDPLGGGYGYISSQENGIYIYTYRITQEDYDKAEPVGG